MIGIELCDQNIITQAQALGFKFTSTRVLTSCFGPKRKVFCIGMMALLTYCYLISHILTHDSLKTHQLLFKINMIKYKIPRCVSRKYLIYRSQHYKLSVIDFLGRLLPLCQPCISSAHLLYVCMARLYLWPSISLQTMRI